MALAVIVAIVNCSACSTFFPRKPWRTYDKMPFDAQKWRDGDEIERGRMRSDMMDRVVGKTPLQVVEMLGEPDEKRTENGTELWLYNTEHPGRRDYLQTPINFGRDGKAKIGTL